MSVVARAWLTALAVAVVALLVVSAIPQGTSTSRPSTVGLPLMIDPRAPAHLAAPPATQAIGGRWFNSTTGLPVGSSNSVTGIAIDSSNGHVFAANEFAASVTEFYESNGTLLDAVPVGDFAQGTFPAGLAMDPAGHRVFVSISTAYSGPRASGWLLVLNESGLGTVANISFAGAPITPFEPTYLAFDGPTNQLYVENQSWGYLAIVNLTTEAVTSYLACPVVQCAYHGYGLLDVPQYHTLVIPTCARQLWFVNTTNDSTRALVSGPPTSLMAWAAYDTQDDALWVENYTFNGVAGSFFRMNLTTLAIQTNVPGAPPRGTDLSYDAANNVLVATNVNGSLAISTYSASTGALIAAYSQGASGSHPFYTVALDPVTGIAIGAGLGDGSTVAFALPSLTVDLVYPSFPSLQVAVAVDPTSGSYFVAGNSPPAVRAVSESTGAVLWTTPYAEPGSQFAAVVEDPAQNAVIAADAGAHQIRYMNASTGTLVFSSALPGAPTQCSMILDPANGDLVVGTTSPAQVLELNPATLSVVASLTLPGSTPCALAFDPVTGDMLALSTSGAANVTVVSPSAFTAISTWSAGSGASGLVVNATGLAFLLEGGVVAELNVTTGASTTTAIAALGGPGTAIASDNLDGFLFVGLLDSPSIIVASSSTGAIVGVLHPSSPAGCLGFDPTLGVLVAPLLQSGDVLSAALVPVPGAPSSLTGSAGNATAWLNWTAPSVTGPYPTDGYVVAAHPISGSGGIPRENLSGTTVSIGGLTDGVAYQFEVFAHSFAGLGLVPALTNVTPLGVPYPPAAVLLVAAGPTSAILAWAPPSSDGGSSISAYTVHYGPVGGTATILSVTNATNVTITGLSPSTHYSAFVTATNGVGTGNPSAVAAGSTPAAPGTSSASATSATLWGIAGAAIVVAAVVGVVVGRWSRRPPSAPPTVPPVVEP